MSGHDQAIEAAAKAVCHELDEVEALNEFSDRGTDEICEDTARSAVDAYLAARSLSYRTST